MNTRSEKHSTSPSCSLPTWPSNTVPASQIQGTFPRFKGFLCFLFSFFFICVHQPTARTTRLIFQNMFLASNPLLFFLVPAAPLTPSSIISCTCSPFPVHHLFSYLNPWHHHHPPSQTSLRPSIPHLPACSPEMCDVFSPISCFAAPLLLQSVRQDSMFYGLIRNDPGRSSQAAEAPKAGGWSNEAEGERGRVPSAVEF